MLAGHLDVLIAPLVLVLDIDLLLYLLYLLSLLPLLPLLSLLPFFQSTTHTLDRLTLQLNELPRRLRTLLPVLLFHLRQCTRQLRELFEDAR